jgi:uncharacterized membrane protein YhaH (DUF805 family)
MLSAIRYNLTHLADFSRRDARSTFWWYVLFLVVLQFVFGMMVSLPLVGSSVASAVSAAGSGASEAEIEAQALAQMSGLMSTEMWVSVALGIAVTLLALAAFVRRLHDSNHS